MMTLSIGNPKQGDAPWPAPCPPTSRLWFEIDIMSTWKHIGLVAGRDDFFRIGQLDFQLPSGYSGPPLTRPSH